MNTKQKNRFHLLLLLFFGLLPVAVAVAQQSSTVQDKGKLGVADLRFDNFLGVVATSLEIKAGEEVGMKFFIEGYSRNERLDEASRPEYLVALKYTIDIHDPDGKLVRPQSSGKIDTVLGMQDDNWRPSVDWSVRIPDTAPGGRYPVTIQVMDEIGGQQVEQLAVLQVRGTSVKTTPQLAISGLEFSPTDHGPWRPVWYYERRSPVYVRYIVSGYAVSPEKRIELEQDWTVVNAEGKEVIARPEAVVERRQDFYPPRYVQKFFSVSLRDPEPGEYWIRVEARDKIGEQAASAEARFVLRP